MKIVSVILALFLFFSCTKAVVYVDTEPFIYGQTLRCFSPNVQAKLSFVVYEEIKENNDILYWPNGLELEKKYFFTPNVSKLSLKLKVANGLRERFKIVYNMKGGDVEKDVVLYSGRLPYREYEIKLPIENETKVETWIEIYNKKDELTCMTGRAIYEIKSNKKRKGELK